MSEIIQRLSSNFLQRKKPANMGNGEKTGNRKQRVRWDKFGKKWQTQRYLFREIRLLNKLFTWYIVTSVKICSENKSVITTTCLEWFFLFQFLNNIKLRKKELHNSILQALKLDFYFDNQTMVSLWDIFIFYHLLIKIKPFVIVTQYQNQNVT